MVFCACPLEASCGRMDWSAAWAFCCDDEASSNACARFSTVPAVSAATSVAVRSCTCTSFPATAWASTSFASTAAWAASARTSVLSSLTASFVSAAFFVPCLASLPFAFVFVAAGFFSAAAAAADASSASAALPAASLTASFASCAAVFGSCACAWLFCRTSSNPDDFAAFETDELFVTVFAVPACGLVLMICTLFMLSPPFYALYRRFSENLK